MVIVQNGKYSIKNNMVGLTNPDVDGEYSMYYRKDE